MKKFLSLTALGLVLLSSTAFGKDKEGIDYVAKVNEEGKFCARVEVATITGTRKVRKCRTLKEWEAAGYTVSTKK